MKFSLLSLFFHYETALGKIQLNMTNIYKSLTVAQKLTLT
ncbi:hypothetical protein bcere0002_52680 [Bacillus cereus ATCC 10876]|uniref:Uncharacterized protein n=1 Tax=Bacillus cereus (strain B4264) TaxID=405532 RepID=B7HG34_BACC4|nr:hypothetical protein BCB4264_A5495 [Bacillus cereus B4264]AGE81362.1 hypothetical protein HD73_5785 [Bacillus thuringiensis serovar kurstaki str. HD73]AIM28861.1 hypothetical protein DF16_orf00445 [Bacillus thuringiensis serovar kurstaki str. YBT-1520]AKR38370.1 Hypothetical protein NF53_5293 [Bacillus thuringiensis serovar indiana]AVR35274.1 hypothetical protein FORC60_5470 [Bacillus cereus]EEK47654.1 hypothetical protein bcere0002_52680 [Bacillus cereus ATCC 10876]EEK59312.1 hypothetical